ncbi:hypothetical protein LCGC14_2704050 [marine sediment metagenome]|uniref:Uncharacterized protein n=1 Tax=marine sediment metagenome TaxID=412755 RepID=A0A0F9A2H1_9ZZZZ
MAPDGTCFGSGRQLAKLPLDKWVQLAIRLELGKEAPKTYELTLSVPGQQPKSFTLPLVSHDFQVLTWLGFSGTSDARAVFYVDKIKLKTVE